MFGLDIDRATTCNGIPLHFLVDKMYILKYHRSRLHSKKITNMHPKTTIQLEAQYKCC